MSALRFLLLMKSAGARYVGGASYTPAGTSEVVDLSNYKVGDVVMIFVTAVASTQPAVNKSGWTKDQITWSIYSYKTACIHKKIEAGDLPNITVTAPGTGGSSLAQGSIDVVGYRGAASAALVSSAQSADPDTTLVIPGVTKSIGCRRLVSYAVDRDPAAAIDPLTSWFDRLGLHVTTFFASRVNDVPPSRYANGSSVVWTGFDGVAQQVGLLMEIT